MKTCTRKGMYALLLALLIQMACGIGDVSPKSICEMNGGRWHPSIAGEDAWCETLPKTPFENPTLPALPQSNNTPTPPPIAPQTCNAIMYVRAEVEVTENNEESSLRECKYKLTVTHTYKDDDLWVLHHCAIDILKPNSHLQDAYWFSDRVYYLETWEQVFTSTYFADGQYSRKGVDRIAAVFNRPECLYLLTSPEVESISIPVKWECAP